MTVDSQQRFIDLVNKDNSLTLTKNDVILGKVNDLPDGRSKTRILAVRGSGYRGGVTLHYQRLRFSKLFGFFQPKVEVPQGFEPTIPLFIAQVELRYGIRLKEDEVIISRKTTEEGDFYVVEAKDTSLVYSDTAEFMLEFHQIEISTVVDGSSLNFVYPTEQPEDETRRIDAVVYSGGWVVPEAKVELSAFLVGQFADYNLMWLTQTLSGESWYFHETLPMEHNIGGALVEYNGPAEGLKLLEDPDLALLVPPTEPHENVLVMRLDQELCTDFVGVLTFYY